MNKTEIVKQTFNFDNPDATAANMADGFMATNEVGEQPMDKAGWLGMGAMWKATFPDIKYILDDIREEGDDVMMTGRITGTFTNDLDMSGMGMGVIPATGKLVEFPTSNLRISFEGDKVLKAHTTDTDPEVAGMAGFMKALGVKPE